MQQSSSLEANRLSASQEIPRIFWNAKVHYRIHKCPPPVPILSQLDPVIMYRLKSAVPQHTEPKKKIVTLQIRPGRCVSFPLFDPSITYDGSTKNDTLLSTNHARTAPQVFNYFGGREFDGLISQNLSGLNRALITKQIRLQDFCVILRLRFFSVYCSLALALACKTCGILVINVVRRLSLAIAYLFIYIF
jgi:hypothetical protein